MRAAYIIETGQWDGDVVAIDADLSLIRPAPAAVHLFATGYAAVKRNDLAVARKQLVELRKQIEKAAPAATAESHHGSAPPYSMEQKTLAIIEEELKASILFAEGKTDEAIAIMKKAAEAESSLTFEFGPPEIVKPTQELLGEMLLRTKNPQEALSYFEMALERAPRRVLALQGLARAATEAGNEQVAAKARSELEEIWKNADELVRKVAGRI
jgi:predicted Zn-dependent protease